MGRKEYFELTYREYKCSPQSTQTVFCIEIGNHIDRQGHPLRNYTVISKIY
jgi:hypothetical protein